jgi:hypothetical protein
MIFKEKLYCKDCDMMTEFGDSWDDECWRCETCGCLPSRPEDLFKMSEGLEDEDD